MLYRSLGAGSFAGFWRYWNPAFGFFLGKYVFAPLKRFMPSAFALIGAFVVCGAIHDLVTTAVRGSVAFLFTPWFLLLSLGVLCGRAMHMDLSGQPWLVRAIVNLSYIIACLIATLALKRLVALSI
jgi:hypothetical protein